MSKIVPVILCGGEGARLWPASSQSQPKIFLEMPDGRTLLRHAIDRGGQISTHDMMVMVTNEAYAIRVQDQFQQSRYSHHTLTTLLETEPRDTGPALAVAARHVADRHGTDTTIVVLPADHLIEDDRDFFADIQRGIGEAASGGIVIFGLKPLNASIHHGYIESDNGRVRRFHEKPDESNAQKYLSSGQYHWNSGIVCARVDTLLQAIDRFAPEMILHTSAALAHSRSADIGGARHVSLPIEHYGRCENVSFDCAVLEKSDCLKVILCQFGWQDIGTWQAYGALQPADKDGNHVTGDAVLLDTRNTIVQAGDRQIGVIGLDNLIVVDTPEALLVANANAQGQMRALLNSVKSQRGKRTSDLELSWGTVTNLTRGEGYQINRVRVDVGAKMALHVHSRRSELWAITSGQVEFTVDGQKHKLAAGQTFHAPARALHRIENIGEEVLELIEVQSGSTFAGEDNISSSRDVPMRPAKDVIK